MKQLPDDLAIQVLGTIIDCIDAAKEGKEKSLFERYHSAQKAITKAIDDRKDLVSAIDYILANRARPDLFVSIAERALEKAKY